MLIFDSIPTAISGLQKAILRNVPSHYLPQQKNGTIVYRYVLSNIVTDDKVHLANALSIIGSRVSTSLNNGMKYHDHNLLFLLDLGCAAAGQDIDLVSFSLLLLTIFGIVQSKKYRFLILSSTRIYNI